jgi:hypothetical protein
MPCLRHADEGLIYCVVAMRVELAKHLADDAGGFAKRFVGLEAELRHGEEGAAVHRLEAVAHVGQRTPDDDAECV